MWILHDSKHPETALVVFLILTRDHAWRDMPNPVLAASTIAALALALVVPFSPLGSLFGFEVPPPHVLGALVGIVAAYLACAEAIKPFAMRATLRVVSAPRSSSVPHRD